MFHNISDMMLQRMQEMESRDIIDRTNGTPITERLRQIPPETGKFLALVCASSPKGNVIEIGTSGGYSSMWLSLACRTRGDLLTTFEILPNKVELARETFRTAGIENIIQLIQGDARQMLDQYHQIAFCFLDAEKGVYSDCYEKVVPNLVQGGLLAADNVLSHKDDLNSFVEQAQGDPRVDALVVPIGKGVLLCRKI
jgi:caffeoyl-CoA O-methyltransferase